MLFQTPWPGLALFAGLTIVLAWQAQRRRSRRLAIAAVPTALLAGLFPLLSYTVTTTSERLTVRTRQLIEAVAEPHADRLGELLTADVSLRTRGGQTVVDGRAELIDRAGRVGQRYPIRGWTVTALDGGRLDERTARSFLKLFTAHEASGGFYEGAEARALTGWFMDWRRVDGRWRISRITWHSINNRPPRADMLP